MVVLITGIRSHLAQLVAGALAAQPGVRVVGADRSLAAVAQTGAELIESPMRGAALAALVRQVQPDVLVHLDQPGEEPAPDRSPAGRARQLQTFELLASAARLGVGRMVIRSSSLVYGAHEHLPAFVNEATPLADGASGMLGDYLAIERFARAFAARRPQTRLAILRCAGLVGAAVASPLQRYLAAPAALTQLGFDPRIQALHIDDAALAFALAALGDAQGVFNIAAEPALLSHAIRLAGGTALPLPGWALGALAPRAARLPGPLAPPFGNAYLRYACVADTGAAHAALGWQPRHTTTSAVASRQRQEQALV
jgi:UDP-glucose 4-epimerase